MAEKAPLICIVDDDVDYTQAMSEYLSSQGFCVATFHSAQEFLSQSDLNEICDLVISDINMPGASGFHLCRAIRATESAVRLPIILITGSDPAVDQARGFEAGADEFISKPFSPRHLIAKIRSLLEIRASEIRRLNELESSKELNTELTRFLSPNLARHFTAKGQQGFLKPHQAEVTVLFVDLRRFTGFSERTKPEEVIEVLCQYYAAVGEAALKYNGTLGHLAGDGMMIFFNDPEPIPRHGEVALCMALEARDRLNQLKEVWAERHYDIDFGMGISQGIATIGSFGFDRFSQYSVIGPVANFASRLCHQALGGQILVSKRFLDSHNFSEIQAEPLGEVILKGIEKSVSVFNVLSLKRRTFQKSAS